jgi:3-deoxy-D-manno-octulosonic-acid transferase
VSAPTSAPLRAYRIVSALAEPLTRLLLAARLKRGKEHRTRVGERRGQPSLARPPGALVWVHGASVGELMSVLPLIERIHRRGVGVLVTSGTVTSSGLAEQRLPRGVIHQFVPLDVPRFVRRFLTHWRPDLALFVESDLWPNMVVEAASQGVPLIVVNGRMSDNSFRRWQGLKSLIVGLLGRLDLCLARTPEDAVRFERLGAPRVVVAGDLKFDVPNLPADAAKLGELKSAIGKRPVVAAASTHAGEESLVIAAHKRLRGNFSGLLTVIVPRHPERGPGVRELAAAAGLKAALRSRGERPDAATDIYIADTVGELGLFYRLAPIVFMGGSLIRHGGQNPIEAAKLGAAILHGPYVSNFTEIYAALDEARGAAPVENADRLTAALAAWLKDEAARKRAAEAAHMTVEKLSGALDRTLAAIEPYLMQLQLRGRANHA